MACVRIESKSDSLQQKGQTWFCLSAVPMDIVIEVEGMQFHMHKFPLINRSGRLAKLLDSSSDKKIEVTHLELSEIPGGLKAFDLVAKFCYGLRLDISAANVVSLRCLAEYLEMTEEYGEGNLVARADGVLNQVLRSWKESIQALQGCEPVLAEAEKLGVLKRCVDSLAMKACTDPDLFGWPMMERGTVQSPGGSVLWNGISTGAKPRHPHSDWWHEDVSVLSLSLFQRLIVAMQTRGIKHGVIAGALMHFAKKHLPVLNRRQGWSGTRRLSFTSVLSEGEQKEILETIEKLLPSRRGITSTRFLCGLLRSAMILNASPGCRSKLEYRIASQLQEASLDDLLFPNLSYNLETLYDNDCIQRIVDHFLIVDELAAANNSPTSNDGLFGNSPVATPMIRVGQLMDVYLAEVAPDVNLKPSKFQLLAGALPEYARLLDDGLYRAIDIYLKAHPWLSDQERGHLCKCMDCRKLSLEACAHAAQNERLPMRVVVQVLFFEQLQLRRAIASCFLVSEHAENDEHSRHQTDDDVPVPTAPTATLRREVCGKVVRENHGLKGDMDNMKLRLSALERECRSMKQEIHNLDLTAKGPCWPASRRLGCGFRSQFCCSREDIVSNQTLGATAQLESAPERWKKCHGRTSRAS